MVSDRTVALKAGEVNWLHVTLVLANLMIDSIYAWPEKRLGYLVWDLCTCMLLATARKSGYKKGITNLITFTDGKHILRGIRENTGILLICGRGEVSWKGGMVSCFLHIVWKKGIYLFIIVENGGGIPCIL